MISEQSATIGVDDLWWRYEGAKDWTLKQIRFEVKRQSAIGIVGPSGAGKTTLILALTGIIPQRLPGTFKGTVRVVDKLTHSDHISEIVKYVGAVFQDPDNQFTSMSVLDEIVFGLENIGLPSSEIQKRVDEVAQFTGIQPILEKHPYEISGGQKQRVAIASTLALKPDVLLLDEPTTDLDPRGRSEVFALVRELKRAGQTMVIVEHESDELAKVADYLILLNEGRIVSEGPTRRFFSNVDGIMEFGVAPPQPTELFYKLASGGPSAELPLSIEEGISGLRGLRISRARLLETLSRLSTKEPVIAKTEPVIQVRDAEYTYPDGTVALRGVTFDLFDKDYVAVIGQNGSGKTTLAKLLNGLLKPTKGTVQVMGEQTSQRTTAELSKIVGYCFQNPDYMLFERTVYDEVALGPREMRLSEGEIRERVRQAIEVMGLSGLEKEHPFFLGKGQRLRLAVATILALNSRILVIDEPTTGQDWRHAKDMMNYLDKLNREEKKTIVIITHHMRYVAEHVSRVLVMANGSVVLDAPTREVFVHVDELTKSGVSPPAITDLFIQAGLVEGGNVPLSVDEARDALISSIQ
jgi:energy-coupling factor transporter ATP-binding protein EcfA2